MSKGIDYAFNPHPSIASLKAGGYVFACRYISSSAQNDKNGKNLLAPEKTALLAAGISIVVVVEEGASRMLAGHSAGVTDATHADAVVKALGMTGMPIYFAADWDATEAQQAAINAYLDGAASIIGRGRVGIYGGYHVVDRALDAGKATYCWQTIAWSGGQWDTRAQLRQGSGVTVGGASCDRDTSMTADYGQYPRPKVTKPAEVVKVWKDWVAAGSYSLVDFARVVAHTDVASLLAQTVKHYGKFDTATTTYLNGLAAGAVKPTDKIKGAKFWVFA
jgi:hypothetical protein